MVFLHISSINIIIQYKITKIKIVKLRGEWIWYKIGYIDFYVKLYYNYQGILCAYIKGKLTLVAQVYIHKYTLKKGVRNY